MEDHPLTKKEKRELAKKQKSEEQEKKQVVNRVKKFLVWVFTAFVLVFLGTKTWSWITTPAPQVAGEAVEVKDTDWAKGKVDAPVTLVEYGDFQCPACADYYALVKRLTQEYPDNLRAVYRHFPLTSIHPKAYDASLASEAAGMQGKFWEMHDLLFEKQTDWANVSNHKEKFVEYAKELGLDEAKFKQDLDSNVVKEKINSQISSASSLRLNSTPTFFLNGEKIEPRSYDDFKNAVEEELKENNN